MAIEAITGGRSVWVSDIDPAVDSILAYNRPDIENLGDISTIDWSSIEAVDILAGGFPCQDVSESGTRSGLIRYSNRNRSGLWAEMAKAVDRLRPQLVLIENVRGLLSAKADSNLDIFDCSWCLAHAKEKPMRALGAVLGDLANLGYDAEWTTVKASDVGAPHHRSRVFIIAYPKGSGRLEWDSYSHSEASYANRKTVFVAPRDLSDVLRGWGRVLGRNHPKPLRTGKFIGNAANPEFWEWMMGLPEGYVTGVPGLKHEDSLRILGNGVVPQQAEYAIRKLLTSYTESLI